MSWLTHHRQGYVVDSKRKPTKNHLILHRATCSLIKPHKRARLTTGAHVKACSLDVDELAAWAEEQTGGGLTACSECQPDHEAPASGEEHEAHTLTRLGKEAMSYVLDLAVMYLDGEERHYRPTVEAVGVYLDKTPKQIMPVVSRLIEDDYLEYDPGASDAPLSATTIIYPTKRAMRKIPAFDEMSDDALSAEMDSLRGEI